MDNIISDKTSEEESTKDEEPKESLIKYTDYEDWN
jgi:hypothetical protein